jgi:hypothetical protein
LPKTPELRAVVSIRPAGLREKSIVHTERLASDERGLMTEKELGGGHIVRAERVGYGFVLPVLESALDVPMIPKSQETAEQVAA